MKISRVGRWVIGLGGGLLVLLVAMGFVAFSVWIEGRYPSDDAKRALLPAAQRVLTKPVVNAISHQVEHYLRTKAESHYMQTGLTLEETIAAFLDESVLLKKRRVYAYRLARVGSRECVAALLRIFQSAPPDDLAYMAQLIGTTGNPAAKAWLWSMLESANEVVVAGAIRGLSTLGGEDVTVRLAGILADGQRAGRVRIEAAAGLGTLGTPAAREALLAMIERAPSNELKAQIFSSLGRYEFSAIAGALERHLTSELPVEMRVASVEALANSSPDAATYLLDLAGKDTDADVRAAAAWAISTHHAVKDLGPALATVAEREPEADVRRRLYEAMLPQREIPAEQLWPVVLAEQDIAARVAGFNALGAAARQSSPSIATSFDERIVPELQRIATSPNSLNIQMRAVFALRRAQTPAAQAALASIASRAVPQVATAARNGLPKGT